MRTNSWRWFQWSEKLLLLTALLPIVCYPFLPATDVPAHLAISAVIRRLLQGDLATSSFYTLHLQPVPYYLAYMVLVPLIWLFPPLVASKIFHILMALLFRYSVKHLCRSAKGPSLHPEVPELMGCTWVFLFYGPIFFWGFVSTLIGLPFVILSLSYLLRESTQDIWQVRFKFGCYALLATLAHVTLMLPVVVMALGRWLMGRWPYYRLIWGLFIGVIPLWFFLEVMAPDRGALKTKTIGFDTPKDVFFFIRSFLEVFDEQFGFFAHLSFFALLVVLLLYSGRSLKTYVSQNNKQWLIVFVLFGQLALFLLFPMRVSSHYFHAWGIPFRYLTVFEVALIALAVSRLPNVVPRMIICLLLGTTFLFVGGVSLLSWHFNQAILPLNKIVAKIPPGQVMWANHQYRQMAVVWPPIGLHMPLYYLATNGLAANDIFEDNHIPIRIRKVVTAENATYILLQNEALAHLEQQPLPDDLECIGRSGSYSLWVHAPQSKKILTTQPDWRCTHAGESNFFSDRMGKQKTLAKLTATLS